MKIRREVVPDEDSEKNNVTDKTLDVIMDKRKHGFNIMEFQVEVFAHEREVEYVEIDYSETRVRK